MPVAASRSRRSAAPSRAPRTPGRSAPGSARPGRPCRAARRPGGCGAGRQHRRGQVADAGEPGEGLEPAALGERVVDALVARSRRRRSRRRSCPCGSAAAAASAAAFLATPAISTPVTSSVRSQTRPARSKTSPSWARRSAIGRCRGRAPPCRSPPRARAPGRRGRRSRGRGPARRRTRSGSTPSGWTRPLVSSRTEAREPIRSARVPTICGSAFDGTARQIRSQPASSMSVARLTVIALRQLDAGQVVVVLALAADLRRPSPRRAFRAATSSAAARRAARRPPCPSCRRRSRPPCAAAAARRATPTAARCSARSAR